MKELLARFWSFFRILTGEEGKIGTDHRYLNLSNLMVVVIQLFYVFLNGIFIPENWRLFLNGAGFIVALALYLIGRFGIKKNTIFLIYTEFVLFMTFCGIYWWLNHGSEGSIIFYFFVISTLFLMFLDSVNSVIIGILMTVFISTLFLLEYLHPEWLRDKGDPGLFLIRRYFGAILGFMTCAFSFVILKENYRLARVRSETLLKKNSEQFIELQEAQKLLSENEERYRLAVVQTGQILYDCHFDTGYVKWFGAIEAVTGYPSSEFVSLNFDAFVSLIHPQDRDRVRLELELARKEMSPYLLNFRLRKKDGSYIFIEDNGIFLPGPDGKASVRMLGTQKNITEKILDQQKLVNSYLFNQQVIDNAGEGIIAINRDGKVLVWNKFVENRTGIPVSMIVGKKISELLPIHGMFDVAGTLEKGFRGETVNLPEFTYEDPAKNSGWYSAMVVPNRDSSGNIIGLIGMVHDITWQKNAIERLEENEERFRSLIEFANEGIILFDEKGKVIEWNRAIEKILGIGREEALGKTYLDIQMSVALPERKMNMDTGKLHEVFNEIFRTGKSELFNKPIVVAIQRPDGVRKTIQQTAFAIQSKKGYRIGSVYSDITEKIASEEALRESEYFFKESQRAAFIGSYKVDFRTARWESSEVLDQMFGIDEVYEKNTQGLLDIIHPDDRESVRKYIFEDMVKDSNKFDMDYRIVRKSDGKVRWMHGQGNLGVDSGGKVVTMIGTIQDITERKMAEETLRKLNDTLQERVNEELMKNREKDVLMLQQSRLAAMGEMVQNIAHQWRQPLNAVGILIQSIEEYYTNGHLTDEFLKNSVSRAMDLILHMSGTIDDFRYFFRADKELERFGIRDAIDKTVLLVEAAMKNCFIQLETRVNTDMSILGYPNEFNQVLLNILNNAKEVLVQRKIEEPRIVIGADFDGNGCTITITDNGGGIDPAIQGRIFESYFTTKESGTGIGLYMSKMIIEKNMSGSLMARNVENGAQFIIRLG